MKTALQKPFFSRKKIAEILYASEVCATTDGGKLNRPRTDNDSIRKVRQAITNEIDVSLEKSGKYLAELIEEKGYSLRNVGYMTGINASGLCKIVGRSSSPKGACRTIPWLNAEKLTASLLGIPCSDLFMGENAPVLLPKKYVPILEKLRAASAAERKVYEDVVWDELKQAKNREAENPRYIDAQSKARTVIDRLEDLAGDRFANPAYVIEVMPASARTAFKSIYRYADSMDGENAEPIDPPTTKTMMRVAALVDVPIDFLITDRYLRYLGAVYYDENQECRDVSVRDMRWLAEAVSLSRETSIEFCSNVLSRMLIEKAD